MVFIYVHGGARSLGVTDIHFVIQVICQNIYKMWFRFLVLCIVILTVILTSSTGSNIINKSLPAIVLTNIKAKPANSSHVIAAVLSPVLLE